MNNVEQSSKIEASLNHTPDGRQTWMKPEAKVADVANATLNGTGTHTFADASTCGS